MKKIIELKDFKRRELVEFFRTFDMPTYSITSEIECTGARERAKEQGVTFSLLYTHAILQAANEIDEFHYRIDENDDIVWYDIINGIFVVMPKNKETYMHVIIDYKADLCSFCKEAMHKISCANHEETLYDLEGELNYLLVSANPFLSFTSVTQPIKNSWEGFMPLSVVGKLIIREGKEYIPINISANHAFVDGLHFAKLYTRVQELLMP